VTCTSQIRPLKPAAGGRGLYLDRLRALNLDNFKRVNDTLGHHSGDLLLQSVAQKRSGCLRSDDILCRIGGDEFAVILRSQATYSATATLADAIAGMDAAAQRRMLLEGGLRRPLTLCKHRRARR
jgi:diguanylate cyclase (GGDEF)-like protein